MNDGNEKWIKTGIALVDEQHREYFRRLNALLDKIEKAELGELDFKKYLDYFRSYAVVHFDTEELLMRISSFPGLEEHVKAHAHFRENIERMSDDLSLSNDIPRIAGELKFFVFGWLEEHINSYDLKMTGFLKEKVEAGNLLPP